MQSSGEGPEEIQNVSSQLSKRFDSLEQSMEQKFARLEASISLLLQQDSSHGSGDGTDRGGGNVGADITQEAAHSTHTVSDTVPVGEEEEENEVFCSASPAEIHLRQVQELEARDWSEEPQEVGRRISSGTVRAELSLLALDQQREEQGRTGRRGGVAQRSIFRPTDQALCRAALYGQGRGVRCPCPLSLKGCRCI